MTDPKVEQAEREIAEEAELGRRCPNCEQNPYHLPIALKGILDIAVRDRCSLLALREALAKIADESTYRGQAKRAVFLRAIARDALRSTESPRIGALEAK